MVRKLDMTLGKGKVQGLEFWVFYPTSLVGQTSHVSQTRLVPQTNNKRKELLKDNIKSTAPKITRLTPEEIAMYAATAKDLITSGETLEDICTKRYAGLHPDDWAQIKERLQ